MRIITILAVLLLSLLASASAASRYLTPKTKPGIIVFIHGVFGDSTSTWTHSRTGAYWPSLVSKDPVFKDFAVYVYEYPSPKQGTTFSINELAENMRLTLRSDAVFDHQSIVILSHSMGGLITRALLLKYRDLVPKIRSLHFFATPTTGSGVAQIGRILSSNPQLGQMIRMDSNTYLADLQRDWLAANFPFPSYCAYERLPTFGLMIVEQQSATNLCNRRLDPINSNHIDIVKPSGTSDTPYLAFRSAFLEAQAGRQPGEASLRQVVAEVKELKELVEKIYKQLQGPTDKFRINNDDKKRIESALHEAKVAADAGDVNAEKAIRAVRETGDSELLQKTIARLADERYRKETDKFLDRSREVATIAYLRGDLAEAEKRVRMVLDLRPNDLFATRLLGILHLERGQFTLAENQFRRLIDLTSGGSSERATALIDFGYYKQVRYEFGEARDLYRDALKIQRKLGERHGVAMSLLSIGQVERRTGDQDKAKESLRMALNMFRELGDEDGLIVTLNELGLTEQERGNLDEAERLFDETIKINRERRNYLRLAGSLNNLGRVKLMQNNLTAADVPLTEALKLSREYDRPVNQALVLRNLSELEIKRKNLDKAEKLLLETLTLIDKRARPDLYAQSLSFLSGIEVARGNWEKALKWSAESNHYYLSQGMSEEMLDAIDREKSCLTMPGKIVPLDGCRESEKKR